MRPLRQLRACVLRLLLPTATTAAWDWAPTPSLHTTAQRSHSQGQRVETGAADAGEDPLTCFILDVTTDARGLGPRPAFPRRSSAELRVPRARTALLQSEPAFAPSVRPHKESGEEVKNPLGARISAARFAFPPIPPPPPPPPPCSMILLAFPFLSERSAFCGSGFAFARYRR